MSRSTTKIRFSAGYGFLAWLIRLRLGFQYNHVDIWTGEEWITCQPFRKCHTVKELPPDLAHEIVEISIDKGWEYALSQVGKPYDYLAVVALACPFTIKYNWLDNGHWFCSELVIASLMHAGVNINADEVWGVTPKDLYYLTLFRGNNVKP